MPKLTLNPDQLFERFSEIYFDRGKPNSTWLYRLCCELELVLGLDGDDMPIIRDMETLLLYGQQDLGCGGLHERLMGKLHALHPGVVVMDGPWIYQGLMFRGPCPLLPEGLEPLCHLRGFGSGTRRLDAELLIWPYGAPNTPESVEPTGAWMVYYDHPDQLWEDADTDRRLVLPPARWAEVSGWLERHLHAITPPLGN